MFKIKKITIVLVLVFLFTESLFAQKEQGRAKIEAQKVAYITKRLELTSKEAEIFWPLYNEFELEKKAINRKYKPNKKLMLMSDEELEQQMLSMFEKDQELLDNKKTFFNKMKAKFPIRKIAMLQVAEKEFRNSIIDKWKENRQERRKRRQERQ